MHHELSTGEVKNMLFAGKQFILVGDFLQLRPVANECDEGHFMFLLRLFAAAFSHRFHLQKVMRHLGAKETFMQALKELTLGICSDETHAFLADLSRNLHYEIAQSATHIFFRREPALLLNQDMISKLQGERLCFEADCKGEVMGLKWPGQHTLHLKDYCKVMLIWNKSDKLKNGNIGTFLRMDGEKLRVRFEGVGTVTLGRQTWMS